MNETHTQAIVPEFDMFEHALGAECPCKPTVTQDAPGCYIIDHHPMHLKVRHGDD